MREKKLAHGFCIPLEKGNKIQRQDRNAPRMREKFPLGINKQNSTPGPEFAVMLRE